MSCWFLLLFTQSLGLLLLFIALAVLAYGFFLFYLPFVFLSRAHHYARSPAAMGHMVACIAILSEKVIYFVVSVHIFMVNAHSLFCVLASTLKSFYTI